MKIKELEYSRTFNLGQYESERIGLRVELDETDDLDQIFNTIKTRVFQLHQEEKAPHKDIQKVKASFPDKWVNLLDFLKEDNDIIVKTREFLGDDEFRELRSIIVSFGGKYVSAGKDSHFIIPFDKK